MTRSVSTTYSAIYVVLADNQKELIGCISETLSETHQRLSMFSLPKLSSEAFERAPEVLRPLLEDGLSNLLKECLFNAAWNHAPQGECLAYLSRSNQGAIWVDAPTDFPVPMSIAGTRLSACRLSSGTRPTPVAQAFTSALLAGHA